MHRRSLLRLAALGVMSAGVAPLLLSYLTDEATKRSRFVVLDASDVEAGPVADVALPQRVPYGFHATWVPAS